MMLFFQTAINRARASSQSYTAHLFWPLLLILILIGGTTARILFAPAPLTVDEGVHLVWAKLLAAGYAPYTEVYHPVPPLWPLLLKVVWSWWPSVLPLQIILLIIWSAGIIGVALLTYELTGDSKAGLGAAALLTFSEMYFRDAQPILMEMPAVVAAIFAIWLALLYQRRGLLFALIGSALVTAISLGLKLFLPFLPLLVLGISLTHHCSGWENLRRPKVWRNLLGFGAIWLTAFLFFSLLSLVWFDVEAMGRQMIGQRLDARLAYIEEEDYWQPRLSRLVDYAANQRGLIVLGILGLALTFFYQVRNRWWLLCWLGLVLTMLVLQTPLRYKHFLLLSVPLAVLAGWLFTFSAARQPATRWLVWVGLIGGFLLFSLDFTAQLPRWTAYAQEQDPPLEQQPALQFIAETTAPEDCMITDYAQLPFWSDRLPPPELAELTSNRLRSGYLTGPELIALNQVYACPIVAPLTGRLDRSTPDYLEWVKVHYYGRFFYDQDRQLIYFGAPLDREQVRQRAVPYEVRFGSPATADIEIELVATRPLPPLIRAGTAVPVTLFWQLGRLPTAEYTVFVQLRDAKNVTVASADHQPYKGLLPFSRWPVSQVMPETTWLQLPAGLPSGDYSLFVGLYNPQSLERLPVFGDQSGENAVKLTLMKVQE